jgi:hypothetical protein
MPGLFILESRVKGQKVLGERSSHSDDRIPVLLPLDEA